VAALARQVGLSPAAIYRHFRGKDEVIEGVLDLIREKLLEAVRRAETEATSPLDALHRLLGRHLGLVRETAAIPRTIFSEELFGGDPSRRDRVQGIISAYLAEVSRLVREGQAQGEIRTDLEVETIALLFLGIIQPSAILWHVSRGRFDAARHAERAWRVLRDAITPSEKGEAR